MWARKRIQRYIAYKAMWKGIPYLLVDPYSTSTTCNRCGEKGERNGWQFKCKRCGYTAYVDENAARNIALRARKVISFCSAKSNSAGPPTTHHGMTGEASPGCAPSRSPRLGKGYLFALRVPILDKTDG